MIDFSKLEQAKEPEKPKKEDSLKLKNYTGIIFTSNNEPREKIIVLDCEYNNRIVFEIEYNKSKREKYIELVKTNYIKIKFKEDDYGKFKQEASGTENNSERFSESIETDKRWERDSERSWSNDGENDIRPTINDEGDKGDGGEGVWCSIY